MKKYNEDMAFCSLLRMWKKNVKKIFSAQFPQQLDDRELMGVAKIWTNKAPV